MKRASDKQLVDFRKTFRTDSVLLGAVERHVVTSAFTDPERSPHVIHPSEISHAEACRRQMYYRIIDTPMDLSYVFATSFWKERIFDEGHDIHDKWQGWLWDMGRLYGYFECLRCDAYWFAKSPVECVKCGALRKYLRYREVPIIDEKYMIGGSADGLLDEGLLEVKSIGKGSVRMEAPGFYEKLQAGVWTEQQLWNEIKRPFPSHVRQGMIYAMVKKVEQVIFIYECKWNQAVKEFVVNYNIDIIAPVLEACRDIKYAVKKHKPIERPRWAEPKAAACKACPYKGTCWSEDQGHEDDDAVEGIRKRFRIKVTPAA